MGDATGISWTDATWNPTTGCTRISPGCDHCYAFQLHDTRYVAWKLGRLPDAAPQYRKPFSQVQILRERGKQPLHWRKPRRIFVDSMADLFHDDVPDHVLLNVWSVMEMAPQHVYQVLTKRPHRMERFVQDHARWCGDAALVDRDDPHFWVEYLRRYRHVWLGTSVEDQGHLDYRVVPLLNTVASLRFLSCEPLLGPLRLRQWLSLGIRWVILGGESGPHYREMSLHWLENVVAQCRDASVPVFVKQDSGRLPGKQGRIPEELWLHEFPEASL